MTNKTSRAWREVDWDALVHNARVLQAALAPGCRLMAVVKADAYGHGALPAARRLEAAGVRAFAVACLEEAAALRRGGLRGKLLILGCTPPEQAPLLRRWKLTQAVAFTRTQLDRFYGAVRWLRAHGFDPGETHIQASYGIWNLPPQPCAWARAGIALYGVSSGTGPTVNELDLRPVLSLKARVTSVRTLEPGEGAGYGLAFRACRRTRLAAVAIGYADGLPRTLPQQGGAVLLHGRKCPMAGRMCMDQLLVDVTAVPCVKPGDTAALIGTDGGLSIRAEEVAEQCGTITNELLSRLGPRLPVVTAPRRPQP